jgi:hypothetical protein
MNEMRKLMEAVDYAPEGDIVATAGEFTVVQEYEMIHVIDGEQAVRLSMFVSEWNELVNNYSSQKAYNDREDSFLDTDSDAIKGLIRQGR